MLDPMRAVTKEEVLAILLMCKQTGPAPEIRDALKQSFFSDMDSLIYFWKKVGEFEFEIDFGDQVEKHGIELGSALCSLRGQFIAALVVGGNGLLKDRLLRGKYKHVINFVSEFVRLRVSLGMDPEWPEFRDSGGREILPGLRVRLRRLYNLTKNPDLFDEAMFYFLKKHVKM